VLAAVNSARALFPHWHAHYDAWLLIGGITAAYFLANRRHRAATGEAAGDAATRRQMVCFATGMAVVWLASDWPVHDVAEGYLYSVHMIQHLMMTLVGAVFMVAGTPAWMWRRLLPGRAMSVVRTMARPVPALVQFNLVLVLSHWPAVVEATIRHHPLHFVAHAVLLLSAVLMWLPIVSQTPEIPRFSPLLQMLYLFLQTVVPTVPASFLTFGAHPLYRIYETFPRLWGIDALQDQQTAGLIMKLVGGFYLWIFIAVIFFKWNAREEAAQKPGTLMWDDVERELQRLDATASDAEAPAPPKGPDGADTASR